MSKVIAVSDELYDRLQAQAQVHGLPIEVYLEQLQNGAEQAREAVDHTPEQIQPELSKPTPTLTEESIRSTQQGKSLTAQTYGLVVPVLSDSELDELYHQQ